MNSAATTGRLPASHFDTAAVPAPERFQVWRESMGVLFDVHQDTRRTERLFDSRLTGYRLDSLMLARCASGLQAFERPSLKIAGDGLDHYLIQIFLRGQCTSARGRNETVVRAGDIWVIDLAADYTAHTSDFENLTLVVPRSLMSGNLLRPDDQHRRLIPGDQPLAYLFKQMIFGFFDTAPDMTLGDGLLSVSPMLRMAEALLGSGEGGNRADVDGNTLDQALLVGIKRYIDDNLRNPGLRPEIIATSLGISRSRLYRLFEPLGGVAAYIRSRRLRGSAHDLLDPAQANRRIYEIAFDWGFEREGDYSRAFRRQYGISPRDARVVGGLCALHEGSLRGPFGDRTYESWLLDLAKG